MIIVTKEMTEEERANVLKERSLTVFQLKHYDEGILKIDPDKKVRTAIRDYARNIGFTGKRLLLEGIDGCVIQTSSDTVKKSVDAEIDIFKRKHEKYDFTPLIKLFNTIEQVSQNAILLEVEDNRHTSEKSQKLNNVKHYLGGFCDEQQFYPVKIVARTFENSKNISVHVTITVGEISLNDVKKKATGGGMHLEDSKESHPNSVSPSFDITIPHLLEFFNEKEDVLLKNFPDDLLSDEQKQIKEKVKKKDKEQEEKHLVKNVMNKEEFEEEVER